MRFPDEIWNIIKEYLLEERYKLLRLIRQSRYQYQRLSDIYTLHSGWRVSFGINTTDKKEKKESIIQSIMHHCKYHPKNCKMMIEYHFSKEARKLNA
jgi:hypothetical protein